MSPSVQLIRADARQLPLADESVDCIVTSPPYWGLRDYGTAKWEGGDSDCSHMRGIRASDKSRLNGGRGQLDYEKHETQPFIGDCGKCGARRVDQQIGLERTPEEYVAQIVACFRECWRVLKPQGTAWVNLGDCYAGSNMTGGTNSKEHGRRAERMISFRNTGAIAPGLKPKDLIGIPWRVAFALQADGWWLRSDIIWSKPNPMPESVTDRPTKAHEYLFLLTKGERYYYDAATIAEKAIYGGRVLDYTGDQKANTADTVKQRTLPRGRKIEVPALRNRRSVWTIPTAPYPEAHFATFPPALVRPCILAGCPVGGTVLDPFGGTGTVGQVALELHRNAVIVDLAYQDLAEKRLAATQPGLAL